MRERRPPEVLLPRYTCSVSSIDIGKLNSEERLRLLEEASGEPHCDPGRDPADQRAA